VPESQRYVSKRYEHCNWAQALEGGIDSSHSSFLHSRLIRDYDGDMKRGLHIKDKDRHPHFEVVDTDYGALVAARRTADEDHYYWRITQFLMPSYTMIPPYGEGPVNGHIWVPIDDHNTMAWTATWHPTRDLTDDELRHMTQDWGLHVGLDKFLPPTPEPGSAWKPIARFENDYLIDWEKQKTEVFSGLPYVAMQDQALQETMGPIYDRTNEHLGVSDTGIIQARRIWLQSAHALREKGVTPRGADMPELYRVRSAAIVLGKEEPWVEAAADHLTARDGVYLPSA
jgi:phthalate 4,5-dioxygenase oxygenase subunit